MDRVDTSGSDLDLDIDLESGGTTSEEDSMTSHLVPTFKNSKNPMRSGFTNLESHCESTNDGDCSCSYDKLTNSEEIRAENKEQLGKYREEMVIFVNNKTRNEEKTKFAKPCKPPRPPKGPSLDASDMKLLNEITVLNLKRKKMERRRNLKKISKEAASSSNSNLFAGLVTVVFLLVIVFQGLLGSRV